MSLAREPLLLLLTFCPGDVLKVASRQDPPLSSRTRLPGRRERHQVPAAARSLRSGGWQGLRLAG